MGKGQKRAAQLGKTNRSLGYDRIRIEDESLRNEQPLGEVTPERTILIGFCMPGTIESLAKEFLDELDLLAQTAGAEVVGREMVKLRRRDPASFIGKGKVEELTEIAEEEKADLLIFDEDLSPGQTRNLETAIGRRIVDRSGLILDIFARRARSREAKTQVELAQLKYMLPRLSGAWAHLERQQGGIGMRGPGETQLETDRRIVRTRIRLLETELKHIAKVHETQRAGREQTYRFALAGYTNVGKSTLMNVLTQAGVYEENLLFATLDSTTRAFKIGSKFKALLSDTVGFIRKLPSGLVASFRTTLAEIREADCILHVIDLSSPSCREQMAEVEKILSEMGVGGIPRINVFNKIDALEDDVNLGWAKREYPDGLFVSARKGTNLEKLMSTMSDEFSTSSSTHLN
jgi:GTP-binding protein HflX